MYNPQTDVWYSDRAQVPDSDTCAAQAQVHNDRLYLVGGWPDGRRLRVYDPGLDSWQDLPDIPESFNLGFVTAVIGDTLYIIGGHPAPKAKAYAHKFDLVSHSWSACAALPKNDGKGSLAGTAVGNKIYVLNGDKVGGKTPLQIYDTENNKWLKGAKLDHHAEGACSIGLDNKVYFFGGASDHDVIADIDISNEMIIYDIQSNSWSQGLNMIDARMFSTGQILNGKFHVLGGFDAQGNAVSTHEVYAQ